jgi:hypothetical protein
MKTRRRTLGKSNRDDEVLQMDRLKTREMLRDATAELETAKTHVRLLQQVVDGLTGLLGTPMEPSPPNPDVRTAPLGKNLDIAKRPTRADGTHYPRPREAWLETLAVMPDVEFRPRDAAKLMGELGIRDPAAKQKAYSSAFGRLSTDEGSPLKQVRTGFYIFTPSASLSMDEPQTLPVGTDEPPPTDSEASTL